jgi:hypothetical protein
VIPHESATGTLARLRRPPLADVLLERLPTLDLVLVGPAST